MILSITFSEDNCLNSSEERRGGVVDGRQLIGERVTLYRAQAALAGGVRSCDMAEFYPASLSSLNLLGGILPASLEAPRIFLPYFYSCFE